MFISDRNGLDLVLFGIVEIETLRGKKNIHEFLVRVEFINSETCHPRIRRYQILLPLPRGQLSILE